MKLASHFAFVAVMSSLAAGSFAFAQATHSTGHVGQTAAPPPAPPPGPGSPGKPACDVRAILDVRKGLFGSSAYSSADGKASIPNPFYSPTPKLGDYTGDFSRSDEEISTIFEMVRELTIQEISAGKPESEWTPAQKLMVTRMKALTVKVKDCGATGTASNAQIGQVITLCKIVRYAPAPMLVMMMGHEFGHSADLCALDKPYYKVDFTAPKITTLLPTGTNSDENATIHDLGTGIEHAIDDGGAYLVQHHDEPYLQPYFQQLESQGLMTKIDSGIPKALHPARNTYACLEAQGYPALNDSNDHCNASEIGAQIWGARALSNYLKKYPTSQNELTLTMAAASDISLLKPSFGGKERDFNKIYLSEPAVQSALGCSPLPEQNCMALFQPATTKMTIDDTTTAPAAAPANSPIQKPAARRTRVVD